MHSSKWADNSSPNDWRRIFLSDAQYSMPITPLIRHYYYDYGENCTFRDYKRKIVFGVGRIDRAFTHKRLTSRHYDDRLGQYDIWFNKVSGFEIIMKEWLIKDEFQ